MKRFICVLIVLALAGAAYWLVSRSKIENYYEESAKLAPVPAPDANDKYRLLVGKPFPDAELIDVKGTKTSSGTLVRSGGVVLFLETSCSNCEAMIEKWKKLVVNGTIARDQIFAICFQGPAEATTYHQHREMNFPLFCDTAGYYMIQHEVHDFPLQLVVGRSGTIFESTYDAKRQVFPDQLKRWLSE